MAAENVVERKRAEKKIDLFKEMRERDYCTVHEEQGLRVLRACVRGASTVYGRILTHHRSLKVCGGQCFAN